MSPPTSVENLPRHLQASTASASSSSNASPIGTPPSSSAPIQASSSSTGHARTPSASNAPLASPGFSGNPPSSPGGSSSSNRFGLNLGFIQRRPRGWTTSSAPRSPGGRGSPAASPSVELPPSPGGTERSSGGYGFPALRRTLSKRSNSHNGEGSRSRARRSSSQPPVPMNLDPGANSSGELRTSASAAGGTTPSGSGGQQQPTPTPSASQPGFSTLTATTSLPNPPNAAASSSIPSRSATSDGSSETAHKLRLVPHLESSRSLHFDPIERDLSSNAIVRVGRFTDRHGGASNANRGTPADPARVAFKSKVVSRGHAEIWVDEAGKFFIRDTKSSSGTFLNHIRLSGPNIESRPSPLKDGDVLQLGVDYQGGTEEIYRCVKMRVELNRGWQRGANSFNTAALAQLRALGGGNATPMEAGPTSASTMTATPSTTGGDASVKINPTPAQAQQQAQVAAASISDCCICLYPVTVCQALFIAPCSHVTHFKCIRPLVEQNYPGFCCPLCRTYANLEADVEIDLPEPEPAPSVTEEPQQYDSALGLSGVSREPEMDAVEEVDEPASRAPSIRAPRPSASRRSSIAALTQALGETSVSRRGNSRPASIAPSTREEGQADEAHPLPGTEEADEASEPGHSAELNDNDLTSSPSTSAPPPIPHFASTSPDPSAASSSAIPLAINGCSSHLAPPSDEFYASLASAATPPNNTFLSTLAETGASTLPAFFARTAPPRPIAAGPPASGATGMGSLDAALLGEAGPSKTSLTATTDGGSASDGDDGDGEASAGDDAETQEAGSQEGNEEGVTPSPTSLAGAAGKGKGKEREVEATELEGSREALRGQSAASSRAEKKDEPVDNPDLSLSAAASLLF
ncbi:hypothetical protein JCM8547_000479 [Rhodosporidiobolus lusitaniae]